MVEILKVMPKIDTKKTSHPNPKDIQRSMEELRKARKKSLRMDQGISSNLFPDHQVFNEK